MAAVCAAVLAPAHSQASTLTAPDQGLRTTGDAVAIALPLVAGGISLYKHDWNGAGQLVLATGATVGTAYLLKHFVKEERPYCKGQTAPGDPNVTLCDNRSFPSDTSALAFAPAQYLWNRYGWEYGVPAYAAAAFVGTARVVSKEHRVWDVGASAVISWTYNWIITGRYHATQSDNVYSGLYASPHGAMIALNYRW